MVLAVLILLMKTNINAKMELHEVPNNTRIRVMGEAKVPPASSEINVSDELNFHHLDGMYSYCTTDEGKVVHLVAWADVEVVGQ